jgi:hypothetical protein
MVPPFSFTHHTTHLHSLSRKIHRSQPTSIFFHKSKTSHITPTFIFFHNFTNQKLHISQPNVTDHKPPSPSFSFTSSQITTQVRSLSQNPSQITTNLHRSRSQLTCQQRNRTTQAIVGLSKPIVAISFALPWLIKARDKSNHHHLNPLFLNFQGVEPPLETPDRCCRLPMRNPISPTQTTKFYQNGFRSVAVKISSRR